MQQQFGSKALSSLTFLPRPVSPSAALTTCNCYYGFAVICGYVRLLFVSLYGYSPTARWSFWDTQIYINV